MDVSGTHAQAGTGLGYSYTATYVIRGDCVEWDAVIRFGRVVEAAFNQFTRTASMDDETVRRRVVAGICRAIDELEPSMLTISREQWKVP